MDVDYEIVASINDAETHRHCGLEKSDIWKQNV